MRSLVRQKDKQMKELVKRLKNNFEVVLDDSCWKMKQIGMLAPLDELLLSQERVLEQPREQLTQSMVLRQNESHAAVQQLLA